MAEPDMDDLFGDDDEEDEQQQQQQQQQEQGQRQRQLDQPDDPLDDPFSDEEPTGNAGATQDDGGEADPTREDLFGSDDEDQDVGAPRGGTPAAPPRSATPGGRTPPPGARQQRFGEPIAVSAPLLPRPPAESASLLKLNNVLHIEPRAFDPSTFEREEDIRYTDERGNARVMLRRGGNVIRWRWGRGPDGRRTPLTNARLVKWSDGTESVMLGDQMLDVVKTSMAADKTYLYVVRYDVIEGQAQFRQKVSLVPNVTSALHRQLKATVHQQYKKEDKVRYHRSAVNPEQEKLEQERLTQERARLREQQQREMAKYDRPRPSAAARRAALTSAFLEEQEDDEMGGSEYEVDEGTDEEEEEEEEAAAGRGGGGGGDEDGGGGRKRGARGGRRMLGDEEEEAEAARRLQSAKRAAPPGPAAPPKRQRPAEDAEAAVVASMEDADEGGGSAKPAPAGVKVRRGVVLDDDEDDE